MRQTLIKVIEEDYEVIHEDYDFYIKFLNYSNFFWIHNTQQQFRFVKFWTKTKLTTFTPE